MTAYDLEIGIQLYGDDEALGRHPRRFGPITARVPLDWETRLTISADTTANVFMRVHLAYLAPLEQGWVSARLALEDMNGWLIGTRPAEFYGRPYDTPTFTMFHTPHFHAAVSIRRAEESLWTWVAKR